jgi:hypothetical protein
MDARGEQTSHAQSDIAAPDHEHALAPKTRGLRPERAVD